MGNFTQAMLGYAATGLIALTVGYFGGREHLKYEMRTAFQSAAEEIQKGFRTGFGITDPATHSKPAKTVPTPQTTEPSPLSLTLADKGFKDKDIQEGEFEAYVTFELEIKNLTDKDIRAFDGTVIFMDLLDNEVLSVKLAINEQVKAGQALSWEGVIDYNQFTDAHKRLRGEDKSNLKITFAPRKVLFADGTSKDYAEKSS